VGEPLSEPRRANRPRPATLLFSGLLAVILALISVAPAPVAAADELLGAAPSPTRSGDPKGSGTALESQPTGRLIVTYRPEASADRREVVRAAEHLTFISEVALPNAELVEPGAGGVAQAAERLGRRAEVLSVEPEYRRQRLAGPTGEPLFGQQWALHNTGQTVGGFVGAKDVDMNVPGAWQITTGSSSLVVAVIDDGVDFSHPDLAARKWVNAGEIAGDGLDNDSNGFIDDVNGWDFCNDDNTVHDADDFHGTHVAGSIGASGNSAGVAGIAPNVRIMAIKFLSDDPTCGTDTQAAAAIAYAEAQGADMINASWGSGDFSATLQAAIAGVPQMLFVAAAGNANIDNDVDPMYPASYGLGNILSVASIHNEGFLTDSTNYGIESVDLSAPGEDILSSVPGGAWQHFSGTSMAAANTTGVAALAASAKPGLLASGASLRTHLIATARALPSTLGWVASPRMPDARAAVVSRPDVRRLSGANRYATAAAISAATYTPNVPRLFIATGSGFPDALAGGAVAAQLGAPLLLVSSTSIPSATLAEIQRLKPYHIFVLGGTAVVSNTVLTQLDNYDAAASGGPYRLAGADRFATAAAISRAAFNPALAAVPTAFIATGMNFPDALAGAPATAMLGGPLLLATQSSLPTATRTELSRLKPSRIVILGGTSMVSASVASALDAYTTGPVNRWAGADRFATAATVAAQAFPASETAFVASGLGFPDALAGGPAAGAFAGPMLLVSPSTTPTPTRQQLQRLQPARIFVLGGTSAVSETVVNQIRALFP
jgi:subtilisin family serine protease